LVYEEIRNWIAALPWAEVAQRSSCISDEFPLQYFAVYYRHESFTKIVANLIKLLNLDLCVIFNIHFLLLAHSRVIARVKSRFNGITIKYSKFFEHDEPAGAVLFLFICEFAIVE
jgi:hypothetical protein